MAPQWKIPPFEPGPGEDETMLQHVINGRPYTGGDKFVGRALQRTVLLLAEFNKELDAGKRMEIMHDFIVFRESPKKLQYIAPPFICEYVSSTTTT